MIIVTGTKRSGTSMWMQILKAAGLPVLGDAFPKIWKETIQDANKHGFYESPLRRGINYNTNPHPVTGAYLPHDKTRALAVKVFIPGLAKSDIAFITRVIGTMRHWREYTSSLTRLYEMEKENLEKKKGRKRPKRPMLSPINEWWLENFMLIRDVVTRRYPFHLVTYDRVLSEPETIGPIVKWLGVGDAEKAIAAVDPKARTQERDELAEIEHPFAEVFDELYQLAHEQKPLTAEFIEKLNETHDAMCDEIEKEYQAIADFNRTLRRRHRRKKVDVLNPDVVEAIVHSGPGEDAEGVVSEPVAGPVADDAEDLPVADERTIVIRIGSGEDPSSGASES